MKTTGAIVRIAFSFLVLVLACLPSALAEDQAAPRAPIDGTAPGFVELGEKDFVDVNGEADTWSWKEGTLYCTGQPVGVIRSAKVYTNFELSLQWRHMKSA